MTRGASRHQHPKLAVLREHAKGKHRVLRLDCPACRKFADRKVKP